MEAIHNNNLDDLEGGAAGGEERDKLLMRSPSSSVDPSSGVLMAEIDETHPSGKQKKRKKHVHHHAFYKAASPNSVRLYGAVIILGMLFLCPFLAIHWAILTLVYASCVFGVFATLWLSKAVLQCDDGTAEMRAVSEPIREGAEGFLHVQYTAIAKFAVPLAGLIVFSYQFRPGNAEGEEAKGVAVLGNGILGVIAALGFAFGAICSALSGYVSMWVAAQSNIRVASAGRRSYGEALVICFRGGAFSAVLNLTLCIAGVTSLYTVMYFFFCKGTTDSAWQVLNPTDIPMLLVGYGFGASFVALFMQLGGGIYTKAADVGADLVGKVEQSIPEDDPRNPAVIADLVGDMVGDCVGSSADVFESVAAEIIGAMILGSTLADEANMGQYHAAKFVFFPLVVHAMDIIVSSIGVAFVGQTRDSADSDPMKQLQKGYRVALFLSVCGFWVITHWLLHFPDNPRSSFQFFLCGVVGMVCAYIIVLSTQYFTDYAYRPVQSISEASTTGHGTNIIVGVSVGMKATLVPTITVAIAVLSAYHLGASTGIGSGRNAGLFGTAVATMGMLSNAVYILSMNNFGPIADNAGG
jgi:H(+)-translocating pyrophosphatase